MGRFINVDAFVSTGTGLLGNNMFAYCNNNPVVYVDSCGFAPISFKVNREGDTIVLTIEKEIDCPFVNLVVVLEAEFDVIENQTYSFLGFLELTVEGQGITIAYPGQMEFFLPYSSQNYVPSEANYFIDTILEELNFFAGVSEKGYGVGGVYEFGITTITLTIIPVKDKTPDVHIPVVPAGGGAGFYGNQFCGVGGIGGGMPLRNPTLLYCFM